MPMNGSADFQGIQYSSENVNYITSSNLISSQLMSYLLDITPLINVTISGTHDSGTYNGATGFNAFVNGYVKTQDHSITRQLDDGIRYLDIRCRHIGNAFAIHHDKYYVDLT